MINRELRSIGKALPASARAHNRSVVLQQLFGSGPGSRAELARTTGLTRVTVSAVVEELSAEGFVTDLGLAQSEPGKVGKKATLVGLSDQHWQLASISLTNEGVLTGAILTLTGEVVHRHSEAGRLPAGQTGLDALTEFCRRVVQTADHRILGVGVSSPGIVSPDGVVEEAPNRGWHDLPLARDLTDALGVPVLVANDANCAALGEFTFGGADGSGLLRLVIGYGVGAGLVSGGVLLRGGRDAAGEIGHVTVVDERDDDEVLGAPIMCACGRRGCLETLLATPALRRAMAGLDTDEARQRHLRAVGQRLGRVLAPVVATLNITELVVSGPDDLLRGPLLAETRATIIARTLPRSHRALSVGVSRLGDEGALRGAAVLVLSDRLGIA
ncbi:ROK family transcriptional regulator [Propionimicrobium sp. PCR01-08-3]|uniref:ROK family transcriptional regulator n=1 Tax=Propionimicrobium sp. PCR01-08-3 TaxID=3052086 RepID=UPI00255CE3BC|nr:ROK family transcriptional regulator [Propionimicrobium sp. PCR01-08-3]WIY82383.1 ROK family transcriptional regulator [Propionimicrobium sp. PCR01-08-3]